MIWLVNGMTLSEVNKQFLYSFLQIHHEPTSISYYHSQINIFERFITCSHTVTAADFSFMSCSYIYFCLYLFLHGLVKIINLSPVLKHHATETCGLV